MNLVFIASIFLVATGVGLPFAYGHGLGGETLPPVTIGDRNVSFSIAVSPSTFDPENPEKYLTLTLSDKKEDFDLIIEHVTFLVELKKGDQSIFKEKFHDEIGNLNIRIISNELDHIEIKGVQNPISGGWMRTESEPLTLTGPVFNSGGLYEFEVEILTLDNDENMLEEPIKFKGAISLAQKSSFEADDSQKQPQEIQIISYFDSIEDFNFESNQITFLMPFDWNQDLEQLSVVHEELKIPNTFEEFLSTNYDLLINGLPMPSDVITIDDYSLDQRTVHIVLNKELLKQIKQKAILESDSKIKFILSTSDETKFPLKAITPDYRYDISVFWEPEKIKIGKDTTFFVDIQGMFAEKQKTGSIEYDFQLIQDRTEIYSTHVIGTINSLQDENKIQFEPKDVGSVTLVLSNIGGNSLAKANFILVVYPDDALPEFPLTISSLHKSNGETIEGSYDVDVTWFPSPIEIGDSEFVLTFYQKDTKIPMKNTEYDFVLIKNGTEIFRKDGNAKAGGTFENYFFSENELGDVTVRVENIGGTSEFIEIPIVVTPEFPVVFTILGVAIVGSVILNRLKFSRLKF